MKFLRLKPFLVFFALGVIQGIYFIVSNNIKIVPLNAVIALTSRGVGASIWAIPYCFFTRKGKTKAEFDVEKS
jgi:hypothetical protein